MENKEFNLSEKVEDLVCPRCGSAGYFNRIHLLDVKEFIRRLKKRFDRIFCYNGKWDKDKIYNEINKLAGEKFI